MHGWFRQFENDNGPGRSACLYASALSVRRRVLKKSGRVRRTAARLARRRRGTPPEIVAKLNAEIARVLQLPEVHDVLVSQGTTPYTSSPQETARRLAAEQERCGKVVRDSRFRLEP